MLRTGNQGYQMSASGYGATISKYDSAQQSFADQLIRFTRFRTEALVTLVFFENSPFAEIPDYLRLAKHMLLRTILEFDGDIFQLSDNVFGCIGDERTGPLINETVSQVVNLMSEGTWDWYQQHHPKARFAVTYKMPQDFSRIQGQLDKLKAHEAQSNQHNARDTAAEQHDNNPPADRRRQRRTAGVMELPAAVQLDFIENQLREIDFMRVVRTQPLCRIRTMTVESVEGQEIYTSIMDLQKRFSTQIEPEQHYLLFNHLTRYLDRFMFAEISQGTLLENIQMPHINVSLDSMKSNGFEALDQSLNAEQRPLITFEINCTDALASAAEFERALDRLKDSGYKVALDSVPFEMLEYLNIDALAVDKIKLIWRRDLIVSTEETKELNRLRDSTGATLVLTRCDHRSAIHLGHELDVDLFQGALIDRLATSFLYVPCHDAADLGCNMPDCRNRHWAPHRMAPDFACPRRTWTAPLPSDN